MEFDAANESHRTAVPVTEEGEKSALGANAGLLSLPGMIRRWRRGEEEEAEPVLRNIRWITMAVIASILFVFVLGRGLTWSP